MPEITMQVVVQKSIELRSGETLNDFTRALSAGGRAHVLKKLNIAPGGGGAWMVEVFKDSVVFAAFKRDAEQDKFFAFTHKRQANGDFEFGDLMEVERVTGFRTKQATTSVSKSAAQGEGWSPARKNSGDTFVDRMPR